MEIPVTKPAKWNREEDNACSLNALKRYLMKADNPNKGTKINLGINFGPLIDTDPKAA